jgi:hypothetical protein
MYDDYKLEWMEQAEDSRDDDQQQPQSIDIDDLPF